MPGTRESEDKEVDPSATMFDMSATELLIERRSHQHKPDKAQYHNLINSSPIAFGLRNPFSVIRALISSGGM